MHTQVPAGLEKNFKPPTMAFLTPWNQDGKRWADKHVCKIDYFSPTWYVVKRLHGSFIVEGAHREMDPDLQKVKETVAHWKTGCQRKRGLVLPRVHFDPAQWSREDLRDFWTPSNSKVVSEIAMKLRKEAKIAELDGFVVDWGYLDLNAIRGVASMFLSTLRRGDASTGDDGTGHLLLNLVVPPPVDKRDQGFVQNFRFLFNMVDRFSLMTYDYSQASRGPVSPVLWQEGILEQIKSHDETLLVKILLGINFYGYLYEPGATAKAVTGRDLARMLADDKDQRVSIKVDEEAGEHFLVFRPKKKSTSTTSTIYYPTPWSLHLRLELARKYRVGVSIWELGQGVERFLELL